MDNTVQENHVRVSPFYCLAVPIAPEQGARRTALMRLEELSARNRWLVKLRWMALAALAGVTALSVLVLHLPVSPVALIAIGGVILAYNFVFGTLCRKIPSPTDMEGSLKNANRLATLQMVVDIVMLTTLLHFSGGVENPFFFYFVFHIIIASILLGRKASFRMATLAVVLFSSLALGEYQSLLAHHRLWWFQTELYRSPAYVFGVLVVFATTMYLAVYFAGDVVRKLRDRERELVGVTTSLEKGALELQEAYQKIKDLEEKKSDFLRVAAHQLRSPLSAIRSLLDVVIHGYTRDPGEERRMLEHAHNRTDIMLAMINDLLSLSRLKDIETVRDKPAETVNACQILSELDELYRPRALEKGVRLELSDVPKTCTIFAAADDVRGALNNLLDNALNYTPPGGTVSCAARIESGRLAVTISDTGIGISPEDLGKIFEEFYRAPNARGLHAHGTGLGLAIVKKTIEKWNGHISVESTPGKGTTFTLEFPATLARA